MAAKKIYRRIDLIQTAPAGPYEWECVLCRCMGYRVDDIKHEGSCPLACSEIVGVTVFAMTRARDVICGACPAGESEEGCVVPDWSLEYHETLLMKCDRYLTASEDI